ncbi:MAG: Crp/Fnr family transcriptional regulator [Microvirga sp.]
MTLEDDIGILSRAPLLGLLDREALRLIAFAAETRVLRPGEVLFRKGDRSDGGYVVKTGAVALEGRDGAEATFVAGPCALVGQTALFTRIERSATASARGPTVVLRIAPSLMRRVLEEFPGAAASIRDAVSDELQRITEGLEHVRRRLIAIDERPAKPPEWG